MTRFFLVIWLQLLAAAVPASAAAQNCSVKQDASQPAKQEPKKATAKKVWTEDDLSKLKGSVSVVGGKNPPRTAADSDANGSPDKTSSARELRLQLAKLQAQIDDADQKIAQLKNIQSGETSGNSGMQLHHGYNMESLPDQIKKLEDKKTQIQAQMDKIYEQARKDGIEPGQLR